MQVHNREKRRFIRFDKAFGVSYVSFPAPDQVSYGDASMIKTFDASASGIRLVDSLDSKLAINDQVEMEISINNDNDFFDALGIVRWKKKVGNKMHFGIELTAMHEWELYAETLDNAGILMM